MRASYAWGVGDAPWQGDAVSLVDAFRRGERSPVEELQATYDAIDASNLNAFCFLDRDAALAAAREADVSLPFGGVPLGVKELERHAGWPDTDASLVFKDRVATTTDTMLQRAKRAGAVLVGQTTSSEFGGVNLTARCCMAQPTTRGCTAARQVDHRVVAPRRLRVGSSHSQLVAMAVDRFESLLASPDWSGSRRHMDVSPADQARHMAT